jgi:hypothetical protein
MRFLDPIKRIQHRWKQWRYYQRYPWHRPT